MGYILNKMYSYLHMSQYKRYKILCSSLTYSQDCSFDPACLSGKCGRNYPRKCEIEICEDKNSWCSNWANWGECTRNPGYMLNYCKVSCNVCTETCADKNT